MSAEWPLVKHPPLADLRLLHTSVSTLEAALKGCYGYADLYGTWVQKSMGLKPKDVELLSRRGSTES